MGLLCWSPSLVKTMLTVASLILLAKVCEGRSDVSRGVAVPFVFDPKATCEPSCKHAGICIRNNTCFCSKGYEGEVCQYGDDKLLISLILFISEIYCVAFLCWTKQYNMTF